MIDFEGQAVPAAPGERLLDALLRAGLPVDVGCRSGICQACLLHLDAGKPARGSQDGLLHAQREQGLVLACRFILEEAVALSRPSHHAPRFTAPLLEVTELLPEIFRVRLGVPDGFEWRAGQYLTVWRDTESCRAYSLASRPLEGRLELHLRRSPGGVISPWLLSQPIGTQVDIQGPFGNGWYQCETRRQPLLLAGNGIGLAPLWGVLKEALASGHEGDIHLVHGVREPSRAYLDAPLRALAAIHRKLHYHVVGSERMVEACVGLADSFAGWTIHLCGSPDTVRALNRRLFLAGAASRAIHADAFIPQA